MAKIVVKFGGSNLREPADIGKVVRVVKRYGQPLVIVVSAFHGITNTLIRCIEDARVAAARETVPPQAGAAEPLAITATLRGLKAAIVAANISDPATRDGLAVELERRLAQLERYLMGIQYLGDVPLFVNDAVLSYGERLSSVVLAAILRSQGIDAEELLPEDLGLRTDGEFGNAACDFEASRESVRRALAADRVFVVPGFYGIGPDGKATLFGRGGSDYTAASIARCVGASSLDVWKDVDGFLSADPGLVAAPRLISQLSYLEAAELSYFGAKILHPRTVEPLLDQGIPIRILNINRPERGLEPWTVIDGESRLSPGLVKGVTLSEDLGILKLHGPGVGFKPGILATVTGQLHARGINIKSVLTAQTAIDLLLARADLGAAWALLAEHHVAGVVELSRIDDLALLALVGCGVAGVGATALSALEAAGLPVRMVGAGASEAALYLLVARSDSRRAIQCLHERFEPLMAGE